MTITTTGFLTHSHAHARAHIPTLQTHRPPVYTFFVFSFLGFSAPRTIMLFTQGAVWNGFWKEVKRPLTRDSFIPPFGRSGGDVVLASFSGFESR